MQVTEVFTLRDNTTVFVGSIRGSAGDVGASSCELLLNGQVVASFPIDGEMILKNKTSRERAVSTTHLLNHSAYDLQGGKLLLRGRDSKRSNSS